MRGLPVLLMCLVLTACGAQNSPPLTPGSSTPATDTSTPSIPAPLPPSSAPLTTTPSRALDPGVTTVRGTVSAGTEAGCLILATSAEQYLLLGADPAIAVAGAEIEVTGKADPGAMTTCQQGTPFHVAKTLRINP
ncbi:hypothetical protein [Lentzea kentuckyensis]|uniref:hypothetical protein n=1 Tax=Lentzea kentuckyensis TaxID=360086 RepID=UPI000A3B8A9E|nr:hypothetical protein [Lentzea kentuckyensis]